jgi:hypothetical protein
MGSMKKLNGRRPSPALVVAIVALLVALTGTAMAAGVINGNLIRKHTVSGAKLKKNTLTGFQINNSKLGTVPTAKKALNVHWAVVDNPNGANNAVLSRSSDPGMSATETGNDVTVIFPVNVSACVNVAGKNNIGTQTPTPGFSQTNISPANPNAIEVHNRDATGANIDGDFHLLVICP